MKSAQIISKATRHICRDEYGALNVNELLNLEQQLQLKEILAKGVATGAVPATYFTSDKKEFECLNHDFYDVLIFRGNVKGLVVQARSFWKNIRKGHTRSQKTYFLIIRSGRKIEIKELENSTCSKRAKSTTALGQLVNHYLGKTTVACKSGAKPVVRIGFKVLAKTDDGRLISAYDGSEYEVGRWRDEIAKINHGGGFYFYRDRDLAISATKSGQTFSLSVADGKVLALFEIQYSGKQVEYVGGKLAASRLRVIRELEVVVPASEERL